MKVPFGVDAGVAPALPTGPSGPAAQVLGLPGFVAQTGVQPSADAPIVAPPGPLKSVTFAVRDQPAGPPR